jgi:hypothetical protein
MEKKESKIQTGLHLIKFTTSWSQNISCKLWYDMHYAQKPMFWLDFM